MTLDRFAGAFWDEFKDEWAVKEGLYEVLVGRSSKDILLRGIWDVKETRRWTGL